MSSVVSGDMRNTIFSRFINRITLLIGQLLVLLIAVASIDLIYFKCIYPDKQVQSTFKQTICLVNDKRLAEKSDVVHLYRADFLISYDVGGVLYSRWVSGNGLSSSFTLRRSSQETLLAQFITKNSYPCWYNPKAPQISVLVLRQTWTAIFPIVIPTVIALVTLYFFFKNLLVLTGAATIKSRIKTHAKRKSKASKK